MTKRISLWWALVAALLVGCGGYTPPAKNGDAAQLAGSPSGPGEFAPSSAPAQAGAAADGDMAPASPPAAESSRSASVDVGPSRGPRSAEPPRYRPGLGTEWGEARSSHVHDVSFARADAERPFAVAQLFYNDRQGVEAQARFHARTAEHWRDFTTGGGAISVAIHDGAGEPLEAVHVSDRTYVVGESGSRYTIVLTNHTAHRFEAVATVDGLDVINGRKGSLENRGYVLMPFATLEIDGFRQSQDAVAAFRFAPVAESYAAQTGAPRNVGVIGVAFFSERGDTFGNPWTDGELNRRETATPFPAQDPRFARPPR